jgi:hypothetical protein
MYQIYITLILSYIDDFYATLTNPYSPSMQHPLRHPKCHIKIPLVTWNSSTGVEAIIALKVGQRGSGCRSEPTAQTIDLFYFPTQYKDW